MAEKAAKLSVAMATFNEAANLARCLDSVVAWVDEVVVVDGGSSDTTPDIVKRYEGRVILADNPPIFHINKQKAVDACTGDWILQLDADEMVTTELSMEIISIIQEPKPDIHGFYIPRKNFFIGHWMRKGGQYPDYVIRLFRRGKGKFPSKSVHEQIEVDGEVGYLTNPLIHYSYKSINEYWLKANRYILLSARELEAKKTSKNGVSFLVFMIFKPIFTFVNLYVRHLGFVDGIAGFLFALFSASHYPLAYLQFIRGSHN